MLKRGRPNAAAAAAVNGAGGAKRAKESESIQPAIGSKLKPCNKFFSTAGCPFGEGCHFLHYVPGGINAVAQMTNAGNSGPLKKPMGPPGFSDSSASSTIKTRICNKFGTPEGCKFGERCHFAHGEWELGKPILPSHEGPLTPPPHAGRLRGPFELPPPSGLGEPGNFGSSATVKISVDASLVGGIIGKGGMHSKHICRVTGVKLSIRDNESDPNLKNIELDGTLDQIKDASAMVRELIGHISVASAPPPPNHIPAPRTGPVINYKTKLCEKFSRGSCTFGDRCHFAHGESELRKAAA